jgi:4-amino-4-deoxychorismate lyase
MNVWVNGRRSRTIDCRDRGLQYGDGLFETMRIRRHAVRLLDLHLQRLLEGCARLRIDVPDEQGLRRELEQAASLRASGVLKLIVTRGVGPRGYRPAGGERCTRILTLSPLPGAAARGLTKPIIVRLCRMKLGTNEQLAGLKTLNRLESVIARSEWTDKRIAEGLMRDGDDHIVCGTMSNLFLRQGTQLVTPLLDRCGVAGVMRRWVLEQARALRLKPTVRRVGLQDLRSAEEVFMTNAIAGVMGAAEIRHGAVKIRPPMSTLTAQLRSMLEAL